MKAAAAIILLIILTTPSISTAQPPSIKHKLPSRYLVGVKKPEVRRKLPEHLMIGLYSDLRSRYMSKEQPYSKGPVWQPSGTVEFYGAGLNIWSNFVINDEANQGEFNEVDFTLYYTARIENLTIHPYLMYLVFPGGDPASLDYSSKPILETDLFLQYDIWKFNIFSLMRTRAMNKAGEIYAHVGVGFTQPFKCGLTLETSALLNLGNDTFLTSQYGRMDANIDAVAFTLGVSTNPWKGLTLKPHIEVAIHVVPEIRRAINRNPNLDNIMVWGGLDLAYNF